MGYEKYHGGKDDYKHGFDLTDFGSAKNFMKVLERNNLKSRYKRYNDPLVGGSFPVDYTYVWSNSDTVISTSNNPLTGAYRVPKMRKKDEGYASYINVSSNDEEALKQLVSDIRRYAVEIKDEIQGDFI